MDQEKLKQLLQPKPQAHHNFLITILGQPKTAKTTLAVTVSNKCPPPASWSISKPVVLNDLLYIGFEPNSLMYAQGKGISIPNCLDWSGQSLTIEELIPAIRSLPVAAEQYKQQGIKTIIVDTLSTFNRLLIRDVVTKPDYAKDMDRIRAYGRVDDLHYLLFDSLRATGLNIVAIVHLNAFTPFGESEDPRSPSQAAMALAAEKQVAKQEAAAVGGLRTEFVPDLRTKIAGHWTRLSDAVLVAKPTMKVLAPGKKALDYTFLAQATEEFAAGGRWDLPPINDGYLRPHVEKRYS